MRHTKHTSTIEMPRQSSYQYVYSLLSKHGLYSSFLLLYLPLLVLLLYYKMVLLCLRLLFSRLDIDICYGYEFTLIVRDFKIITTPLNPSTVNAEAWLSVLTHGSACSIRRKYTPSIIVKNSNATNNISHLLFEDVYKNRDNIPT